MPVLTTGRIRYTRLVRMYVYDKNFIERDGEPFGYVRCVARREKGQGFNIPTHMNILFQEMVDKNWIGCSAIPEGAARILPNMYLQVLPAKQKLYNLTGLVKYEHMNYYQVYNLVLQLFDMPSRREIRHALQEAINTSLPHQADLWQIKDCLNDGWANVGTDVEQMYSLWIHLKEYPMESFTPPSRGRRPLRDCVDDGDDGDVYLRTRVL